jgi:hypothetical protein
MGRLELFRRSRTRTSPIDRVERKKKQKYEHSEEVDYDDIPMIDRVPTAIDYESEGSEVEWLEERSLQSRYSLQKRNYRTRESLLSDDEDDDHDDRYSVMDVAAVDDADSFEADSDLEVGNTMQQERETIEAVMQKSISPKSTNPRADDKAAIEWSFSPKNPKTDDNVTHPFPFSFICFSSKVPKVTTPTASLCCD